jgi:hypothetical protein
MYSAAMTNSAPDSGAKAREDTMTAALETMSLNGARANGRYEDEEEVEPGHDAEHACRWVHS